MLVIVVVLIKLEPLGQIQFFQQLLPLVEAEELELVLLVVMLQAVMVDLEAVEVINLLQEQILEEQEIHLLYLLRKEQMVVLVVVPIIDQAVAEVLLLQVLLVILVPVEQEQQQVLTQPLQQEQAAGVEVLIKVPEVQEGLAAAVQVEAVMVQDVEQQPQLVQQTLVVAVEEEERILLLQVVVNKVVQEL